MRLLLWVIAMPEIFPAGVRDGRLQEGIQERAESRRDQSPRRLRHHDLSTLRCGYLEVLRRAGRPAVARRRRDLRRVWRAGEKLCRRIVSADLTVSPASARGRSEIRCWHERARRRSIRHYAREARNATSFRAFRLFQVFHKFQRLGSDYLDIPGGSKLRSPFHGLGSGDNPATRSAARRCVCSISCGSVIPLPTITLVSLASASTAC